MTPKIVIATHGRLAEGILNSFEIIAGKAENISTICAYIDPKENIEKTIRNVVENNDYDQHNLIVLTDLLGGSVNNEFMKYLNRFEFELIANVNLGLLLEVAMTADFYCRDVLLANIENHTYSPKICNVLMESHKIDDL